MKPTKQTEKKNVFEMVTARIVAQMEQGQIPWHKPWTCSGVDGAISHESGKPYSLVNQMLLGKDGEWLTFMQVQKEGGRIKVGEEASFVVFWKQVTYEEEREDGEKVQHTVPVLKYYNVWHIDQTEGIEAKHAPSASTIKDKQVKTKRSAEKVISQYVQREGIRLINDKPSNEAFYRPSDDTIVVPLMQQFDSSTEYYSTLFHEATHSTGHATRLNRLTKTAAFGSGVYSREELVAEMGAAYLCTLMGVETAKAMKNSAAYIQSWLRVLKNDPKMVVVAAGKAEAAVRYIMGEEERA